MGAKPIHLALYGGLSGRSERFKQVPDVAPGVRRLQKFDGENQP